MVNKWKIAINAKATGKLPQGDPRWSTFNDDFENRELDLMAIINDIYNGHAYTTWHTGRRSLANFTAGEHIAVDLDTGDERSSLPYLMAHPFYIAYGAFIHTTPSHTDAAPRARVFFTLDETITDANRYTVATNFVMAQFDGADTVCKDASRFFYGAKNCDVAISGKVLSLPALRTLHRQWKKAHPTWSAEQPANVVPLHKIEDARQRRQHATVTAEDAADELANITDALKYVDPWSIDYKTWIGYLGALHDEFGDSALPIAEAWAKGEPGEVRRKWFSFRGSYAGKPTTLASIYADAYRNGYKAQMQQAW